MNSGEVDDVVDIGHFRDLKVRWEHLEHFSHSSRIDTWQSEFERLTDLERQMRLSGYWTRGRGDLMGVLGHAYGEVLHCRVLGWLLDPLGAHALGARVLNGFLGDLERSGRWACHPHDLNQASVVLEESRPDPLRGDVTRADVIVNGPGWTVVVEAKVGAGEQPRQCERLEALWGDDPSPAFVFLTTGGYAPSTARSPGRWIWYRWSAIAGHLATALDLAPDPSNQLQEVGRRAAAAYLDSMRQYLGS